MKNKISILILIFISSYSFSQSKIDPNVDIMLFLGRVPQKTVSNSLPDNLMRIIYYNIQPEKNLKIGYLSKSGKILLNAQFNMGSDFYGNYANIIKDSTFGYIDKKGNSILLKEYDKAFFYYGNTGIAKKNEKYGLIDRKGDSLTNFSYTMISNFGFEYFKCQTTNKKSQILDKNGNIIFNKDLTFDIESHYFTSDSILIYQENVGSKKLKGLVNIKGEILMEPKYQEIYFIDDKDFYVVKNESKYGFINNLGHEIIPLIYDDVSFNINENLVAVKKNGRWGFIDKNNNVKIPFLYDEAYAIQDGLAFTKKGEFYGCIDKENKVKINFNLEKTEFPFFSEKLALFKNEDKYGFIGKNGKIKIPLKYDKAYPFIDGLALVELNGKLGYINKKGIEVIPIKYKQLWFESEGIIRFAE